MCACDCVFAKEVGSSLLVATAFSTAAGGPSLHRPSVTGNWRISAAVETLEFGANTI